MHEMKKMSLARLGLLLLALLLLSSQVVEAQDATNDTMNTTMPGYNTTPTAMSVTMMTKDKNGSGRTDAVTLLLPLALAASLLHGCC